MLSMDHIVSFFPQSLRPFRRNILREYLQCKILEAVFSSDTGRRLAFLGGTAIHIVHGNPRFSEDLDFDTRDLSMEEFEHVARDARRALSLEGFEVELATIEKGNFRANLKFIGLLQRMGITGHREEKLLIHLDAEPQNFEYEPQLTMLHAFDVFCRIKVVPVDVLLSQKIGCILQRPRPLGRDFYDVLFLWGKTRPNEEYLAQKIGIASMDELWSALEKRCASVDLKKLSADLIPFVADSSEVEKIILFPDFITAQRRQPDSKSDTSAGMIAL
jgi:predicted nucleotidyltransferase component of viral defense system